MSRINLTDEIDLIVKENKKAKTDAFEIPEKEDLINRPETEKNLLTVC